MLSVFQSFLIAKGIKTTFFPNKQRRPTAFEEAAAHGGLFIGILMLALVVIAIILFVLGSIVAAVHGQFEGLAIIIGLLFAFFFFFLVVRAMLRLLCWLTNLLFGRQRRRCR